MAHVVSCRFLRLGCSEDEHPLFRREYARSNRAQGVKLLRCFPHCCPEHASRSYCGCSVHLLVTFAHAVSPVMLDDLEVCTRFEPTRVAPLWPASLVTVFRSAGAAGDDDKHRYENERKLEIGEDMSLPESLFATKPVKDGDEQSVWVRGKRQSDAEQRGFPENTVLYAINNHTLPKWLYGFNSSATRSQREMTHHLVAYVLKVSGSDRAAESANECPAAVMARHASPAFYLVSLRRSGFAKDPGCDLPAINNVAMENAESEQKQQNMQLIDDPHEEAQEDETTLNREEFPRSQGYCYPNGDGVAAAAVAEKTTRVGGAECKHIRELYAREFGSREKCQHLFILWKFLKCVSLRDIAFRAGSIDSYLRSYLVRVASASPSSEELEGLIASFLSGILEHPRAPLVSTRLPRRDGDQDSNVIRATVYLFLRASASSTIQRLVLPASTAPIDKTSMGKLQAEFMSLTSNLYVALDDLLVELSPKLGLPSHLSREGRSPGNQGSALPALVDDILSLVYGRTRFNTLRTEISAMLMSQQGTDFLSHALEEGFTAFTAQGREMMIAAATRARDGIELDRTILNTVGNARYLQSPFSCRWVLEPKSVTMIDIQSDAGRDCFHDLGVVEMERLVREFGCVDVVIQERSLEMSLQSVLSSLGDSTLAPMKLVLDGRFRVFRVLPSGLSSMVPTAGGWLLGDYVATISSDGRSLDLNLFGFLENSEIATWNTAGTTSNRANSSRVCEEEVMVRRVHLSLSLEQDLNRNQPFTFVDGTVFRSTYAQAMHRDNQNSSSKLSEKSSTHRAALWNTLKWLPLLKVQAKYVCARF